jgi:hypothetical protein
VTKIFARKKGITSNLIDKIKKDNVNKPRLPRGIYRSNTDSNIVRQNKNGEDLSPWDTKTPTKNLIDYF